MGTRRKSSKERGFTLIEAIIAITILGVLGGTVAVFIRAPIQAYLDTANRDVLTDAADGAMRRIGRDVASALPNSLRSDSAGSTTCFEFLSIVAGGRYRHQTSSTGTGDILDFTAPDTSFDVLGQTGLGNLPGGTNLVAIYNLGISGADAYALETTARISSATTSNVVLSSAKQFPFASPAKAFQVIPNYSVVYSCSGRTLYRTTQSISLTKMASCPTGGTALVTNVSNCSFNYLPAVNERDGILSISLALTLNNETVTLYDQVLVNNEP